MRQRKSEDDREKLQKQKQMENCRADSKKVTNLFKKEFLTFQDLPKSKG